jgi:hypothetical protein
MVQSLLAVFGYFRSSKELSDLKTKLAYERDLRERSDAVAQRLETELSFWKQKSLNQDAELSRLHDAVTRSTEKVADSMSLHAIGKRIFSRASDQPPGEAGPPIPPQQRQFARQARQAQAQATRDQLADMWAKLPNAS